MAAGAKAAPGRTCRRRPCGVRRHGQQGAAPPAVAGLPKMPRRSSHALEGRMPSLPCTWAQVGDPNLHCQSRPNAGFIRHPCRSPAWRCRLARRHRRSLKVTILLLFFQCSGAAAVPRRHGEAGGRADRVGRACQPSCGPAGCGGIARAQVSHASPGRLPRSPEPRSGQGISRPPLPTMRCPTSWQPEPRSGQGISRPPLSPPPLHSRCPGVVGHSAPSTDGRSHTPSPTRHAQAPPSPSRRRPLRGRRPRAAPLQPPPPHFPDRPAKV